MLSHNQTKVPTGKAFFGRPILHRPGAMRLSDWVIVGVAVALSLGSLMVTEMAHSVIPGILMCLIGLALVVFAVLREKYLTGTLSSSKANLTVSTRSK